jgi:Subtilase family/Secretion system C-terminal sorting domain
MKKKFIMLLFLFSFSIFFAQESNNISKELSNFTNFGIIESSEIVKINSLTNNISISHAKLSTDLLQLIEPKFIPLGSDLNSHFNKMVSENNFELPKSFSTLSEKVNNSLVNVYIKISYESEQINEFIEKISDYDKDKGIIVGWVPINKLEALGTLNSIKSIRTVQSPIIRTGSILSEGDGIHNSDDVRVLGSDGTGIKVGIISDGVDSRAASQASGDLPGDGSGLTVLSNSFGGDEGTAMLEIVHDLVPGADLYFHDLGGNVVAFNTAIDNLVAAGCNIICDDIGWLFEPFFEDGTVGSHVSSVIAANDIVYLSSAGNDGNSHYQGSYSPISATNSQHNFGAVSGSGPYLYLNMSDGGNVRLILQWNDLFGTSTNDYNLLLYSWTLNAVVGASTTMQNGDDDPIEFINYTANTASAGDFSIIVTVNGSPTTKNLEVFMYHSGTSSNYTNNISPTDAIYGHPAVIGAVGVGAVPYNNSTIIETFSSQGPVTMQDGSVRSKPDVVGVDGGLITGAGGFGSFDGTNYRFYGTSAAAPHVAAVVAQIWSASPTSTGDAVRDMVLNSAIDLGNSGFDYIYGNGRADALAAYNDHALPVELTSFSVLIKEDNTVLEWETATEVNNYGFEIERKPVKDISSNQINNWGKIGFVSGYGNSNSPKLYSFKDKELYGGNKFAYRLKQIDIDGKFEYSDVIEVNIQPENIVLNSNYPNPFNPTTKISFSLPQSAEISLKVYNVLGREVKNLVNEVKEAGVYSAEFDASNLSSGVYYYTLSSGDFTQTKKMILVK